MLDIGFQELAVIGVLALLIFGPDKLPDLGRRLGRAMREFRRASDEFRSTVEQNLQLNVDPDISPASPVEPASTGPAEVGAAVADAAPVPAAAGPAGESGTAETVASPDGPLEPYWTSRGGRLLHRRECSWRARVPEAERVPFKTVQDGWDQGLKACPACVPPEVDVPA
jgi:TatA/E family protein of Tat protein translocase